MNRLLLSAAACGLVVSLAPAQLRKVAIATGLARPTGVVTPNDPERLFVTEQSGRVRVIKNGTLLAQPFLDITARVDSSDNEEGLLGLAFHPDYATNGFFYVSYTQNRVGSVIDRVMVSGNPDLADPATRTRIFGPISQPFGNHNGGGIAFGPNDGLLYYGLGDGGSGGDPGCRAQDRQNLLGKMLRLDMNGNVPPSNPFVNDPNTHNAIWALGLRNPWRFSFDRENGDLYIGDVGQNAREEIDYQPASSTGGENYGWKVMEGLNCFAAPCNGAPPCNDARLTLPVHEYVTGGNCSVTGGVVYRGCGIPSMQGHYWYGDYCSGRIWSFVIDANGQATDMRTRSNSIGTVPSLTSFGEDHNGEILIVQRGGTIWRVEAVTTTANDLGFGTPGGNGEIPEFSVCGLLTNGQSAEFRLDGAAANAPAALVVGLSNNPTNFPPFGILVPVPPLFDAPFTTDNDGKVRFTLPGGTGAATVYAQWAVLDAGAPNGGIALSNALEIFFR